MTDHSEDAMGQDLGQPALTADEIGFRRRLLAAAERLDIPTSLFEARFESTFGERRAASSASGGWLRTEHVLLGISLGLAAAVALFWGVTHQRTRLAVGPDSTLQPITAGAQRVAASAPARLIVWDGEAHGTIAKGWSSKDKSGKLTSTIEALAGAGYAASTGLKWHSEGRDWTGFGWNWFSWLPGDAGTDISSYQRLVFKIRIEGKSRAELPETSALMVDLHSSGGTGKKATESVKLSNFIGPELLDGKWHELTIPFDALGIPKNSKGFEPKTAWEFGLGHWSLEPRSFSVQVDDIGFDGHAGSALAE